MAKITPRKLVGKTQQWDAWVVIAPDGDLTYFVPSDEDGDTVENHVEQAENLAIDIGGVVAKVRIEGRIIEARRF